MVYNNFIKPIEKEDFFLEDVLDLMIPFVHSEEAILFGFGGYMLALVEGPIIRLLR